MVQEFDNLQERLRLFAKERDWDQFHSPKNLSMALAVEASELLEHFQWLTEDESRKLDDESRAAVADEMADVLIYLIRLATKTEIDLLQAVEQKIVKNAAKYPVERSKGNAKKYDEFKSTGDS